MASISELSCIYSALILHNDEVMVTGDKIKALIHTASVNHEPFWPGLFAKALASVNIRSHICDVGAWWTCPSSRSCPIQLLPQLRRKQKQRKKSNDDTGFGFFWLNFYNTFNKKS
uniref:Large ribosomal subunit protein P1 n=1 Tax=Sus scrofa TaxID=9823 RepID=A0A8D0NU13_PIG